MSRYAMVMQPARGDLTCNLTINSKLNQIIGSSPSITAFDFKDQLKIGTNKLETKYENVAKVLPYEVSVSWYSKIAASSIACPLILKTNLESSEIKVNETIRLSIQLINTEPKGQPMSVAVIGIPGGMSLQPWQLKELQDKEVFDFYEITDGNLVVYYRELGPKEIKNINLDLKAEVPGVYRGIASLTYIYYMNDEKHWIDGIKVNVRE